MKSIVVYYSSKGSNKFLATKISKSLNCDIVELKPRLDALFLNVLNLNLGYKALHKDFSKYDRVILCGPIYMGKFISPLKTFLKRNLNKINKFVFVSCCGSPYEKKDEKFGHNNVFNEVKEIADNKCEFCQAFPIDLIVPQELKGKEDNFTKFHINQENFKGEIVEVYQGLIEKLK